MARRSGGKKQTRSRAATPGFLSRFGHALRGFLTGEEVEEDTAEHLQEIKGFLLIGLALWLLVSMATYYAVDEGALTSVAATDPSFNWGGRAGRYLATWIFLALGWSGYCLPFLGIAWGLVLVARKAITWPTLRILGGVSTLVTMALWLEFAFGQSFPPDRELPYGVGGWLAWEVVPRLVDQLGGPGLWILLTLAVLVSIMLATQMAFYPSVVAFREWVVERRDREGVTAGTAIWSWTKRLLAGLWDFLRGQDLDVEKELAPTPSKRGAGKQAAGKQAAGKAAPAKPKKSPRSKKAAQTAELFDDDDSDEDEEEEEWEYVDEDGNLIDPGDLDEGGYEFEEEDETEDEEEEEEEEEELQPAKQRGKAAAATAKAADAEKAAVKKPPTPVMQTALVEVERLKPPSGPWKFPPPEMLEPPGKASPEDDAAIELSARKLESALASFRVEAAVVKAQVGPAVTLFELEVTQGTRMNKVTQLSQEIAAALRAKSVRIIAPIPGKSTIGIEVPNQHRRIVRLSELITQKAYDKKFMALPLFLGMDAEGQAVIEDLSRMPHLLIAGTTGSGKSVCINTILASLLLTRSPHDVNMILVDPKMVELQMFSTVPHLMLPVVNDMKHATNVLLWAVEKMEGRYEVFKNAGVRNIKGYNALSEEELRKRMGEEWNEERTPRHVPHIVIVIDEMADLMMTSKKEAEQAITRLAQKSRAVGIHVIVATQRPSTDVITGVLKGNLPTRIAFQVASKVDSRVIMDVSGAEKLLGGGDMLYQAPQSSQVRRVQGALVEDHEIQALVDYVSKESAPSFSQELVQAATGTAAAGTRAGSGFDQDDLFDEAVRIILKTKRGSASLLQRALGIGYTRASRLIDLMTAEGIVGDHKGSKARELLMTLEDWEEMHGTPEGLPSGQGASDE